MTFFFREYSQIQRKTYIDSVDVYKKYLYEIERYNSSYRFSMGIQKHKDDKAYVYKRDHFTGKRTYIKGDIAKATEMMEQYNRSKDDFLERVKDTKESLLKREKYNKFEQIARVPDALIDIYKKINELGLDKKILLIGTNSLYAYEAKCGVFIEQDFLSTGDIDLLNKRNKAVSLAIFEEGSPRDIIEILKSIDKTFVQNEQVPYVFSNKKQVVVELINPHSKSVLFDECRPDPLFEEIIKLEMTKIEWLENARLFQSEVIGESGKMARLTTIHPLDYAVYKLWLSQQNDRNPMKAKRDLVQSRLVSELIQQFMPTIDIDVELANMRHISKVAIDNYKTARQKETNA